MLGRLLQRVAALLVIVASQLASPASAFDVLRHWNSTNITTWPSNSVSWTVSTSTMPGVQPADYVAAIQAAFDAWEDVTCSAVNFTYQGYASSNPQNGIHVYVQEGQWDPSVGDAAAYSQSDTSFNGNINSNVIVFNAVDIQWSVAAIDLSGYSDIQGVVTHEIGHSIGLDHSRHPDATMFFSGGGVDLRTLSADDIKGACFLYPSGSYSGGTSCDACDGNGDCNNGNCWNWGGQLDGYAYCMENCSNSSQCPDGFSCVNVGNPAVAQCYPDNEYCTQAGSTIALGDACYGHETCQSSFCLVTEQQAYCSKACSSDSQCGAGFTCNSGYCFVAGTKGYGDSCDDDTECQSAFCVDGIALGTGVCSEPCGVNGGSCPPGSQCLQDVICVPPGGKPNGASCLYPTECLSSYCESGKCSQPCGGGLAACPSGTQCNAGWCEGSALGGQCKGNADCGSPLICLYPSASADFGSCGYDCQPLAGAAFSGCPEGFVCDWFWQSWNSTIAGRCVPETGGAGVGESCVSTPCEADLVCALGIGTEPTCHRDCKLNAGSLGCDTTTDECKDLIGDPNDPLRGICVYKFGTPPPVPDTAPDVGPEEDLGPTTPEGADVGVSSDLAPRADVGVSVDTMSPQPDTSGEVFIAADVPQVGPPVTGGQAPDDGCAVATHTPSLGPWALFAFVAALFFGWRRRL